jgi:hypothetical protein
MGVNSKVSSYDSNQAVSDSYCSISITTHNNVLSPKVKTTGKSIIRNNNVNDKWFMYAIYIGY